MKIDRVEFENFKKKNVLELPILGYLYKNKDKAIDNQELSEVVDDFLDLGELVGLGYVDYKQVNRIWYGIITKKGIKYIEKTHKLGDNK